MGFNLGYGFGDTSAASENMIFVDGVAHKLDTVTFNIPCDDEGELRYTYTWRISDDEGRLSLMFVPIVDRCDLIDVAHVLVSDQHQVFGRFYGSVTLDDGTKLDIDGLRGFAENVHNRY